MNDDWGQKRNLKVDGFFSVASDTATISQTFIQLTRYTAYDSPSGYLMEFSYVVGGFLTLTHTFPYYV